MPCALGRLLLDLMATRFLGHAQYGLWPLLLAKGGWVPYLHVRAWMFLGILTEALVYLLGPKSGRDQPQFVDFALPVVFICQVLAQWR